MTDDIAIVTPDTYDILREREYPYIKTQLDMLWHDIDNGVFGEGAKESDWYKSIKETKDKYPK